MTPVDSASTQALSSHRYRPAEWSESGTWREESLRVPGHLAPVVSQLFTLRALHPGWNSYRAAAISQTAVVSAVRLLVEAGWQGPLPTVSPTSRGGVHLGVGRNR